MRAAVFHGGGVGLKIEDIPVPAIGEEDILLKVAACGVCHTDLHYIEHGVPTFKKPPIVLGHEASGIIEAVGSKVSNVRKGQRVLLPAVLTCGKCVYCRDGRENICSDMKMLGNHFDGAYAEYVAAPAKDALDLPDSLPLEEACIIADAVSTPYHAVKNRAKVRPGDTVVVFGCGGVGINAVQLAAAAGGYVIAVDINDRKLQWATEFGAAKTINATKVDRVSKEVKKLTGGGADIAMEVIGNPKTIEEAFESVRIGGRLVIVGYTNEAISIVAGKIMFKEIEIVGSLGCRPVDYIPLIRMAAQGRIDVKRLVTHRFRLDELSKAFEVMKEGASLRSIVVPQADGGTQMPTTEKWVEIKAQKQLKSLLRDYFLDLDAASRDPARQVAWCTSVGPCEILSAFGYAVYFPENHGALLGARKVSHQYIPYAVNTGYCPESCSYMNSDIGAALAGFSPLQDAYGIAGPPTPAVLAYSTNQCREVQDWWSFFGRRHEAPVFGVRPPTHLGTVSSEMVRHVRSQLFELINQIAGISGRKFSLSILEEVVHRSSRASTLWNKVLDTARNHPSPVTFFDGLIQMAPVVVMRGSQQAIEYYETLLSEMQQRVNEGVGAVPNERHRLYWEGMPVWPKIRELSEKFFDLGAVIAASTYCNSWAFAEYEGGDPLDWMARTSIEIFINRDEEYKQSFLADMFDRFDIDGAIFHNARTCPNNTNSRFGMSRRIRDELDLPVLVFDGDLADVRFFSTAQTMTNLEAFIEQLEARKR